MLLINRLSIKLTKPRSFVRLNISDILKVLKALFRIIASTLMINNLGYKKVNNDISLVKQTYFFLINK